MSNDSQWFDRLVFDAEADMMETVFENLYDQGVGLDRGLELLHTISVFAPDWEAEWSNWWADAE